MMKTRLLALFLFLSGTSLFAQEYFPVNDGVKSKNNNYTAFTNAKIYVTPTQVIDGGTLLIQKGKVVKVGTSVIVPKNTIVIDLNGKIIYPSFIDVYSDFGVEKPKKAKAGTKSKPKSKSATKVLSRSKITPKKAAKGKAKTLSKATKTTKPKTSTKKSKPVSKKTDNDTI